MKNFLKQLFSYIHRNKIFGVFIILLSFSLVGCGAQGEASGPPDTIRLDYAHYSPTSLVLKNSGWLEEEFAEEGIEIEWVFSQGSNKSLEFLTSDSVDFGSTAGGAALISASNGAPIQSVYTFSNPEWSALATMPDSGIQSVEDLEGKSVAATIGTDPYIFLLRALNGSGIDINNVDIVSQQHSDGAQSLVNGEVDAWAGLDPTMASVEVNAGSELFYRNPELNTYGFLNVRNDFAEEYPEYVERVIGAYEKARQWTVENPEETVQLISEEANISEEVAEVQYNRNDFSQPIPGEEHQQALIEAGEVLQETEVIDQSINIEELVNQLINPEFSQNIINQN